MFVAASNSDKNPDTFIEVILKIWREFCPTEKAAFSVREHAGYTMKCSIYNSLAYDTRDRPLIATKGVLLKVAQEYAGLLGDAAFVKHQFDVQVSPSSFVFLS